MYFLLTLFALIGLVFSVPAHSAPDIGKILNNFLSQQEEKMNENGLRLERDGDLQRESVNDYQAVTLPALTFHHANGHKTKIGLIAVNASQDNSLDREGWKMSIALPTPILYVDAQDHVLAQLDIGNQQMNAIWDVASQSFTNLSGTYSDLTLTYHKQGKVINIDQFSLNGEIQNNDLKTQTQIKNISFGTIEKSEVLTLDNLSLALRQQKQDDNKNLTNQNIKTSYQGLNYKLENTVEAHLIPQKFQTNITLDNLPLKEIWELGKQALEAKGKNTGMQQLVMLQAFMTLPDLLSSAGTHLKIENTNLTHTEYSTDLKGDIKSHINDTLGASGIINITTHNLDPLIQKILHLLKEEEKEVIKSYKSLMKRLELLNKLSEETATQEEETGSKKQLTLKLTPEGKLFVNDQGLSNIFLSKKETDASANDINLEQE